MIRPPSGALDRSIRLVAARRAGYVWRRRASARPAPSISQPPGGVACRPMPPAKFFVNRGIVSSRTDMLQPPAAAAQADRLLPLPARPRGRVATAPAGSSGSSSTSPRSSTYFTPLSICLNIDSFEHLEFETRPDQLLVYTLVQGDERVVIEFAPIGDDGAEPPLPRQLEFDTSGFVQMELLGLDAARTSRRPGDRRGTAHGRRTGRRPAGRRSAAVEAAGGEAAARSAGGRRAREAG